jgi:hypothetical protein
MGRKRSMAEDTLSKLRGREREKPCHPSPPQTLLSLHSWRKMRGMSITTILFK